MPKESDTSVSETGNQEENTDKKIDLLQEYEKFLFKKGFETKKLRNTARKHIESKRAIKNVLRKTKSVHISLKTKDEYKDELRKYYLGDIATLLRHRNPEDEQTQTYFYEWNYCYVFKNPDAVKKEKLIDVDDAQSQIDSFFKPMEQENDVQKSKMKHAHDEVVHEILTQMADENGKVRMFKGGRFTKIEPTDHSDHKKRLDDDPNKEEEVDTSPKWIDNGSYPRDIATLVYNIFIFRINIGLCLDSESIMSLDGNSIYIVVKADEGDLKRIAEESNYTMQLAIGLTDLTSLEPCDIFYRPLRKCDTQHEEIAQIEKELEEYFAVVEGNVSELLREEPLDYQPESGIIGDISDAEWRTYHEYLKLIKEGYEDFKRHTYRRPHMKGVHLRSLAVNALDQANKTSTNKKGKLHNLWDRLGVYKAIGTYADFKDNPEQEYLWRQYISDETLNRSIFRDSDRIKLTDIIINKQIYNKMLVKQGYLRTEFNFHNDFDLFGEYRFDFKQREDFMEEDELELQAKSLFQQEIPQGLRKDWGWFLPPATKIRNYYGEKIAFYFQYLNYSVLMLIFPALLGIIAFVLQLTYEDSNRTIYDVTNILFALVVVCWASVFYEYWKRNEIRYAVIWGQTDFVEDQVERVDFHGIWRRSPVHDRREIYFPSCRRLIRIFLGIVVTLLLIGTVIAVIIALFELRQFLFKRWQGTKYENYIVPIVSTVNAIQIVVFNIIYNFLAFLLTRFENHKTQTAFERSLIMKTFIFQFVNSFNTLFYIAFIKREQEGCLDENDSGALILSKDNTCFRELYAQLRSIFIIAIFKNFLEIGLPFVMNYISMRKKAKYYKKLTESNDDKDKLVHRIEKTLDQGVYAFKDIDGTYFDYLELMIQSGYFLLFGLAFPLCFFLAFVNNVIEHQVDRAKLMFYSRRPTPLGADSIGVWRIILYFLATMGVFTHAAILCVTAETFSSEYKEQFIEFIWCSIVFLIIRWCIGYLITDIPKKYIYVIKRHENIANKFLVGLPEASKDDNFYLEKTRLNVHSKNDAKHLEESCNLSVVKSEDSLNSANLKAQKNVAASAGSPLKSAHILLVDRDSAADTRAPGGGKRGNKRGDSHYDIDLRSSLSDDNGSVDESSALEEEDESDYDSEESERESSSQQEGYSDEEDEEEFTPTESQVEESSEI